MLLCGRGDGHWLPSNYNIFQHGALPYSYHERRYLEFWGRKFLTCNVLVVYLYFTLTCFVACKVHVYGMM